ncbi:MAG TPA: U32 family peptidase [Firmicutes bacterium]|nr:U32 family peptidase [Bacillota bacterium]
MDIQKSIELLAPAGDMERLEAAVRFGADAVYLGAEQFGMRAASAKFDFDTLKQGTAHAHAQGVKVYLTCNTLPHNAEMESLPDFLRNAAQAGIDALIISDIGVLTMAKHYLPDMEIHISTQAGIVNYAAANAYYQMGAKRVVLARELSLEEIARLREKTPPELDIEAFVHGAMCVSFSGRCLLSSYLTGRDANRGECAQPCRWGYHLMEEKRPGLYFPVFEDEKGTYILNAKDLCMIEHIDKLAAAGIKSFKIEGRAKSSYYVSVVTNAYRMAIDAYLQDPAHFQPQPWLSEEVRKVSHRQYSTGFFFGRPEQGQYYENGGYIRSFDIVAVVEGYRDGRLLCRQRNKFCTGDRVEILEPGKKPQEIWVPALYDGEGNPIEAASHAMMELEIPCTQPFAAGSIIRREIIES